jgi:serine phosphatase RsbU (regulator of sigma subunit)
VGGGDPAGIVAALLAQLRAFMSDAPQHDDMTMVVLQICQDDRGRALFI